MLHLIAALTAAAGSVHVPAGGAARLPAVEGEPADMLTRIPRAEWLLGQAGCTACHSGPYTSSAAENLAARAPRRLAPSLAGFGERVTAGYVERFLTEPALHGAGPDLTSGLGAGEREALAHFLRLAEAGDTGTAEELDDGGDAAREPQSTGTAQRTFGAAELEAGRGLFHTIGCVACHTPQEEAWEHELPYWFTPDDQAAADAGDEAGDVGESARFIPPGTFQPVSIPLRELEERHTVASLSEYLLDPVRADPDGGMPGFALTTKEATDLAVYLLRDQALDGRRTPDGSPGLLFERYEGVSASALPDFDALSPDERGVVPDLSEFPDVPEDHFGLRFTGHVEIPTDGLWTFALHSDDGSRLELDGKVLVDNDGLHGATRVEGTRELRAGLHTLRLDYWEEGGDAVLDLTWAGPGVEEQPLPPSALSHERIQFRAPDRSPVDAELARRGALVYERLGCGACHDLAAPGQTGVASVQAPALFDLELDPTAPGGCLSPAPRGGLPRYGWTEADRAAVAALIASPEDLARSLAPAERLDRELARSACYACHERDGRGGPYPTRSDYFRPNGEHDLGEEGRIPPHLTLVGAKLKPEALEEVLAGDQRVRPYVATRMPQFATRRTAPLADLFATVDGGLEWDPSTVPSTPAELRRLGRQLVGTENGLGCIQCHRFQGVPSLGIQAVDLSLAHRRLQPAWLANLLLDPDSVRMNSRMPSFWERGRSPVDVLEQDPVAQTAAILAYLAEGENAAMPPGLVTPDWVYELDTDEGDRAVSVFMRDVSPRTQLVGSPLGVHVAFDAEASRLARIWTGRFFNAKGTWEGRAGALEDPMGRETIELPAGAPVARIAMPDGRWPDEPPRRLGQRYDAEGRPSWRYAVDPVFPSSTILVTESTRALEDADTGEPGLLRRLELTSETAPANVFVRLHDDADSATYTVRVLPDERGEDPAPSSIGSVIVERAVDGRREILVAPSWQRSPEGTSAANLELEYRW